MSTSATVNDVKIPEGKLPPQPTDNSVEGASKQTQKYDDRVVAFIDILGFKDIIQRSKSDPEIIGRVFNALTTETDKLKENYIAELNIPDLKGSKGNFDEKNQTFSDCVVISVKNGSIEELGLLIYSVFNIARHLLISGYACRGGIAAGQLLHQRQGALNSVVFGPAFIEAYTLEETHADGPRIILKKELWQKIDNYRKNHSSRLADFFKVHIKRAHDGPAYIDIFADFTKNDFYCGEHDIRSDVEEMRDNIISLLDTSLDRPKAFLKNAYLAELFNEAVSDSQYGHLKINKEKLPPPRKYS